MSALMVNAEVSFNDLKELLDITDGNLASHLKNLEESGEHKGAKRFCRSKNQYNLHRDQSWRKSL
jgi:DNA-binding MarR family transcriptional regulator